MKVTQNHHCLPVFRDITISNKKRATEVTSIGLIMKLSIVWWWTRWKRGEGRRYCAKLEWLRKMTPSLLTFLLKKILIFELSTRPWNFPTREALAESYWSTHGCTSEVKIQSKHSALNAIYSSIWVRKHSRHLSSILFVPHVCSFVYASNFISPWFKCKWISTPEHIGTRIRSS